MFSREYSISRGGAGVARRAHNPKVGSSNLPPATNIANRKRYRFEKPGNHNGFWVFRAIFQGAIQKILFPQNDLWGGPELKHIAVGTYF